MRKLLLFPALLLCVALTLIGPRALLAADTWIGWLTVSCCKTSEEKPPAQHPRECFLHCASGASKTALLALSNNQFLTLDDKGKTLAIEAANASTIEKGVAIKVTGKLEGDVIKVATLEIIPHDQLSAAMKKEMEETKIAVEKVKARKAAEEAKKAKEEAGKK
jgi:hypothetical protein